MALTDQGARNIAAKIIEAIGQSDQLKTIGPNTASGATAENQIKRGELDAAYLAALYVNLVQKLKE